MSNTLESSRIFPYVAWATVISFALFTYALTIHLNTEVAAIANDIDSIENRVRTLEEKSYSNMRQEKLHNISKI